MKRKIEQIKECRSILGEEDMYVLIRSSGNERTNGKTC